MTDSAAALTSPSAGPFDLATGDFNRDGISDLAVANADGNSISVLLGKGRSVGRERDGYLDLLFLEAGAASTERRK
jgi:hypothetical protein